MRFRGCAVVLIGVLLGCGTGGNGEAPDGPVDAGRVDDGSAGAAAPTPPAPADSPLTPETIALGNHLFFDKRLSRTNEVACGSCHVQEHAFADPRRFSVGVEGRLGTRNAPALVNLAWSGSFFWDGGVDTLERQAMGPIMASFEMDLSLDDATARVASDARYQEQFMRAYGAAPSPGLLVRALASFVRSLVSRSSRWDDFQRGDHHALTAAEQRGRAVFFGEKAECFHCHDGPDLTNDRFANNGTYSDGGDVGRERVTGAVFDRGRFKVPTLRNVAVTAPYMHDGSIATLEDVVRHYVQGGNGHPTTDPNVHPLDLTAADQADLVAFLRALTDEAFLHTPAHAPLP